MPMTAPYMLNTLYDFKISYENDPDKYVVKWQKHSFTKVFQNKFLLIKILLFCEQSHLQQLSTVSKVHLCVNWHSS